MSSKPLWGDGDSSVDEYIPDIDMMRARQKCSQQVFSNEEENPRVRRSTEEERRAYTITVVEQARVIF